MTDTFKQLMADEAEDLGVEAAVLRDDAARASDPLKALSLTVAALRCEQEAEDLEARIRPI